MTELKGENVSVKKALLKLVWFGDMEFGRFIVSGESYLFVVIHDIFEKINLQEEHISDYAEQCGYSDYLIPKDFEGEVVFSKTFLRRMLGL
jgi:hypothetical protein